MAVFRGSRLTASTPSCRYYSLCKRDAIQQPWDRSLRSQGRRFAVVAERGDRRDEPAWFGRGFEHYRILGHAMRIPLCGPTVEL